MTVIPNTKQADRQSTLERLAALAKTAANGIVGVVLREDRRQVSIELLLSAQNRIQTMKVAEALRDMFEAPLTRIASAQAGDSPELEQSQYHSKPAHTFYAVEKKGVQSIFKPQDKNMLDRIAKGLDFRKPADHAEYRQRILGMARIRNLQLDAARRLADLYIAERIEENQ